MKGERTNYYDRTNHYIEVTSPVVESGKDKVIGVMLVSVSTDNIETTKQVLYTHGSVIVGIVLILLAMLSVFFADRMVRPIHKITGAIENVTEGYSDDVLHVDTFTETRQLSDCLLYTSSRLQRGEGDREPFPAGSDCDCRYQRR